MIQSGKKPTYTEMSAVLTLLWLELNLVFSTLSFKVAVTNTRCHGTCLLSFSLRAPSPGEVPAPEEALVVPHRSGLRRGAEHRK